MNLAPGRRRFLKSAAVAGGSLLLSQSEQAKLPEVDTNASFWTRIDLAQPPALEQDLEVDIAVVGGGFAGLSSALHLSQAGFKVALLEARQLGNGASGRNGGMVLTQIPSEYMDMTMEPELHKRLYEVTARNIDELFALTRSQSDDCDFDRKGTIYATVSGKLVGRAKVYFEKSTKLGLPIEYWDREKTRQQLGTDAYFGALYDPNGGHLHPMKLVRALAKAAAASGASLYGGSLVTRIEEGPVIRLHVGSGHIVSCRKLVLATNAYSSKLGYFEHQIAPLHAHVAVTAPLTDAKWESIGWKSGIPICDDRVIPHYMGITRDRRIHIGGGSVQYQYGDGTRDRPPAEHYAAGLARELCRLFPVLRDSLNPGLERAGFDAVWTGYVDMTRDGRPSFGVRGQYGNFFYANGFCGHGVNLTFLAGKVIADLCKGDGAAWDWLPMLNWKSNYLPGEPLRNLMIKVLLAHSENESR